MIGLVDVYPDRGLYRPGDTVRLDVVVSGSGSAVLECDVTRLATVVARVTEDVALAGGEQTVELALPRSLSQSAPRAYGAEVTLRSEPGGVVDARSTAFDVLAQWTSRPRYGFLADFAPERSDFAATIEELNRFHINALQFYDWHHLHDSLLPSTSVYDDPLGRRLSLETLKRFVEEASRRGMAAMAYVAVYAASLGFWESRPDWALYDSERTPLKFGDDFLGLMNPARGGPWISHLLREVSDAIEALGFDGIHVDQYGEPRTAFDSDGRPVDLPVAFGDFVRELKRRHPDRPVTFNAVKNWPTDELIRAPIDFAYVELWEDTPTYREIGDIVRSARERSGERAVVVALYLPADRPVNNLLADAVIGANGGSRIELGEEGRLLADPYFPLHQHVPPELRTSLRRYCDFRVRYGDLLGDVVGSTVGRIATPDGVWGVARDLPGWVAISLVNMSGIEDARWDHAHPAPRPVADQVIEVHSSQDVREVWWASPDEATCRLRQLHWERAGDRHLIRLPLLDKWGLVAMQLVET